MSERCPFCGFSIFQIHRPVPIRTDLGEVHRSPAGQHYILIPVLPGEHLTCYCCGQELREPVEEAAAKP